MRPAPTGIEALEAALAAAEEKVRALEAQLRNLADRDPLTYLRNRASMEQVIEEHVAACLRYGPSGALLMLGISGLDHVTGTAGVVSADELRVELAEGVARRLRNTDVVGRWADDELAVLLPRASHGEGQIVAKALMEVTEIVSGSRSAPGDLSASVGVAFVDADGDADGVVVRASMAMLASRKAGGRRATFDPLRPSHLEWLSRSRQHVTAK